MACISFLHIHVIFWIPFIKIIAGTCVWPQDEIRIIYITKYDISLKCASFGFVYFILKSLLVCSNNIFNINISKHASTAKYLPVTLLSKCVCYSFESSPKLLTISLWIKHILKKWVSNQIKGGWICGNLQHICLKTIKFTSKEYASRKYWVRLWNIWEVKYAIFYYKFFYLTTNRNSVTLASLSSQLQLAGRSGTSRLNVFW